MPEASVALHGQDDNSNQNVMSGSDGAFTFENLKPGRYLLIASKDGFLTSSALVQVKRHDRLQVALALSSKDPTGSAGAAASQAKALEAMQERLDAMQKRMEQFDAMQKRIEQLDAELSQVRAPAALPSTAPKPASADTQAATAAAEPAAGHAAPPLPLYASLSTPPLNSPSTRPSPAGPLSTTTLAPEAGPVHGPAPLQPPAPGAPQTPPAPAPPAPAPPGVPDALQPPDASPAVDNFTPFAFGDFTWLNGNSRNKDTILDTKLFTLEARFDTHYMEDFNQPIDHTIVGSTESFRSDEVQIEQISVGGDFHWQNVRGRILTMFGLFATTTPRNDASFGVGQWDLRDAYRYVSEAWGGYHFNVNHGLNVDGGIFVSYIGLFSYYNFDNWTYQPSYVSSNTPWFFNGARVQWFPTNKLKIEPWFINGWQSYGKYNGHPGLGGQLLWLPKEWFKLVSNQYGFGEDNLGLPHTERIHTDNSIEIKYYNKPSNFGVSKMAFSLTGDLGCQYGGGIQCTGAASKNKESFIGWMAYNRTWFHKDLFALTLGGGEMSNWGRYLTLLPPINGADAVSGSPYFTENPGQKAHMWDSTVNFHYMPREYITWWAEFGYRHSDIPYFAGRGGVTPPGYSVGGTNGSPGQFACMNGAPSGASDLPTATASCSSVGGVWFPDLRRSEAKLSVGVMVKF